jgi:hypothetical protein
VAALQAGPVPDGRTTASTSLLHDVSNCSTAIDFNEIRLSCHINEQGECSYPHKPNQELKNDVLQLPQRNLAGAVLNSKMRNLKGNNKQNHLIQVPDNFKCWREDEGWEESWPEQSTHRQHAEAPLKKLFLGGRSCGPALVKVSNSLIQSQFFRMVETMWHENENRLQQVAAPAMANLTPSLPTGKMGTHFCTVTRVPSETAKYLH